MPRWQSKHTGAFPTQLLPVIKRWTTPPFGDTPHSFRILQIISLCYGKVESQTGEWELQCSDCSWQKKVSDISPMNITFNTARRNLCTVRNSLTAHTHLCHKFVQPLNFFSQLFNIANQVSANFNVSFGWCPPQYHLSRVKELFATMTVHHNLIRVDVAKKAVSEKVYNFISVRFSLPDLYTALIYYPL